MVKVAFDAPRGPFRFDPVTHNPIENIYFCEIENLGDHIGGTVGFTIKNVRDPGVKPASL